MVFKNIKPTSPGRRSLKQLKNPFKKHIKPLKSLTSGLRKTGGRNNKGRITAFQRGGGHKRLYRTVDSLRTRPSPGFVVGLEYDPNRTGRVARVLDSTTGELYYILAPQGLKVGDRICNGPGAPLTAGNNLPVSKIPIGSLVYNINPGGSKSTFVRSAGTTAQLVQKNKKKVRVKLPSGEQRWLPITSTASLGVVTNENWLGRQVGKAGRSRWLGRRPNVRGVAMNPVDHPHGGGEGKTSGGRPSVTPWGKPAKGQPTRKRPNQHVIEPRPRGSSRNRK